MLDGSLPPASNQATWTEAIEIRSAEDNELVDLSSATEITLRLRDYDETTWLTLKQSQGQITLPSTGIIQWRAETADMRALDPKSYDVGMIISFSDGDLQFILGRVSILKGL